ncbi:MAG: lactate racemase domain-containing protein [Clostridiaceae bacterium]|nr:lactate racemase domain-containing protein [Clostridiaceae bacterium]
MNQKNESSAAVRIYAGDDKGISPEELQQALTATLADKKDRLTRVLLIPPDYTRCHSGAGQITALYYRMLHDYCPVDILPAIGTHDPMTPEECLAFFGPDVPFSAIIAHNWRKDVVRIGTVPGSFVESVSEGLMKNDIDVEINKHLLNPEYDLIISIGQVVPHEVVGMANYSKNIFVGCGGSRMINQSHMLGAFYGLDRIMGHDHSPVRKVFDYAEEHFLTRLPLMYVLTVTTAAAGKVAIHGLFAGRGRSLFEAAVQLSQKKNLTFMDHPLKKVVVYLDEKEFKSTWIGNKAVYRTRLAMAEGGQLIILAPGVRKFGEDEQNDRLIRKYGYIGREAVIGLVERQADLQENLSVAAHLIHGSSDGHFSITYAVAHLTQKEIEQVNFHYQPYAETVQKYDPAKLKEGFNQMPDGEEIYFISNPALGLWSDRARFAEDLQS